MKQIYRYILPAAAAALTLHGCGNEDNELNVGNVAPVITATIEGGQSRVIDNHWEPGDEIGITRGGQTSVTANNTPRNVCYVTEKGDGVFTVKEIDEQLFYNGPTVIFAAYYPRTETTAATIPIDTSDQTKQQSFDYLFASATGTKESPKVDFKFAHKMSMVTFVFQNGRNYNVSNITSYQIGKLYMKGNFSICNGGITTPTNSSDLKIELPEVKKGEPVTPIILLPQTVPGKGPLNFEISDKNGETFEASLPFPDNKLEAGKNYKFTITVNKDGLTVNECSIEDWNDYVWPEGGGEGTADSADNPEGA